jgi:hypothetical protein
MLRFLDRNHEIGAGQIIYGAMLGKPIGTASADRHLFEGIQRER